MDKAVIVGTYEFIGYQLCEALLQEGIEVYGVHIPTNTSEQIVDEKRLLIGRNSNFIEKDAAFLSNLDSFPKDMFIFLDYYSFYMNRKEDIFMKKSQTYLQSDLDAAAILPIQKLKTDNVSEPILQFCQCKFRFYLPCSDDPLETPQDHDPEDREWRDDRIPVEDVVEMILKIIEDKNSTQNSNKK